MHLRWLALTLFVVVVVVVFVLLLLLCVCGGERERDGLPGGIVREQRKALPTRGGRGRRKKRWRKGENYKSTGR